MWGSLLAGLAATQATTAIRRAARRAILLAVAGMIAVIGAGFLLAAAYMRLSASYDPVTAGLAIGFCLLIVAGVVAFAARRHRPVPAAPPALPTQTPELPQPLAALAANPVSLPVIAFAVGLLVARSGRK